MRIRIADRRFAPSLFATVLLILAVAAFVRLGLWQLHRAEEKQTLLQHYAAGEQTTLDLTAVDIASIPLYQHVRARGHYEPAQQILLDNMPSQHGVAGYRVVTPFQLEQGGWLLVDRGWVAMGATRSDLPSIPADSSERQIAGRYDTLPRAGIELAAVADTTTAWPRVMNYPHHTDIESTLKRSFVPGVVLLDPDQPEGYERVWQARFQFGPERHLAYAVQWFAFATAAIVIFLIVSFRREANR